MGQIVGAALLSHHPGLMQNEEMRKLMGAGTDSDLIAGYAKVRKKIEALKPDTVIIFDSHWFTTGFHLVDGRGRIKGNYVSSEMPWYLFGVDYDFNGNPELANHINDAGLEMGVRVRSTANDGMHKEYATINIIKQLHLERLGIKVVSASCCQNCRWDQFLPAGETIAQGIKNSDAKVVLIASGALSHRFNNIDWEPVNPRIYHESNVSSPENVASDKVAIALMEQGNHEQIINNWESEYKQRNWEAFGGHYLQMLGALGGVNCKAKGTVMSDYENARGTGNVQIWFDVKE
ncbi:MAG: hypothetical protein NWQ54_19470 [Paraglaciecola sp.]|uniref:DODA-type extradiol aromatic ring-opening family dioxygenase n=1 Tax=Pseudomonadati TaxID=3379134 RepID=UPI00273FB0E7|nr:hypothetical protein [Paraglaciecola sp.]MDP5032170.1 hypothetical protein [Paraglaciecola sp.]MDP5133066.1 hypothetical protein [Paraglaciecola sp.]